MPEGAATELMERPVSSEAPPIESPISSPDTPTVQESHTPLIVPNISNAVDEDLMRREVQNMIAAQEASSHLDLPHQNPHEKKQRKNTGKFLAKHKMIAFLMSAIKFIFAPKLGAFKQDRSGGRGH